MGFCRKNQRGAGAVGIALTVAIIGAILVGSLLVLNTVQRRAAFAGAAGQVSKDASVGGVELMNQLISSGVLAVYPAQFPPVDADCVTKGTCNTTFVREAQFVTAQGFPPDPSIGMGWTFSKGYVASSGAKGGPGAELTNLVYRSCNPFSLNPAAKLTMETDISKVFAKVPVIPTACATIDTKIVVNDAKSGAYLEMEAQAP